MTAENTTARPDRTDDANLAQFITSQHVQTVTIVAPKQELRDLISAVRAWRDDWRGMETQANEEEAELIRAWDSIANLAP